MKRLAKGLLGFIIGCLASYGLFAYWTPRCNESCSVSIGLAMYVVLFFIPIATTVVGLATGRAKSIGQAATGALTLTAVVLTAMV